MVLALVVVDWLWLLAGSLTHSQMWIGYTFGLAATFMGSHIWLAARFCGQQFLDICGICLTATFGHFWLRI